MLRNAYKVTELHRGVRREKEKGKKRGEKKERMMVMIRKRYGRLDGGHRTRKGDGKGRKGMRREEGERRKERRRKRYGRP